MDSTFRHACEQAAARFEVPALAVGTLGRASSDIVAVGCDPDTRFRVASITKPFTATAVLRTLPPETSAEVWPETTVGDLLSHLSGYDCEFGDLSRFGDADDALGMLADSLGDVRRFLPAGEVWSYSNAGYWLAGGLLARRAGRSYEDAIAALTKDVGLDATTFGDPDVAGTGPEAQSGPYPRARRPSGGLVSTVRDLLRFAEWQLDRPELAAMCTPLGRPAAGVYGLGLAGERVGSVEVWGHDGSFGGFESSLLLVPARAAAFVGLTNSSSGRRALQEIVDEWFDSLLGARRPVSRTVELTEETLTAFAGDYENSNERIRVSLAGGGLVLEGIGGADSVAARPLGSSTFEIVEGDAAGARFDFPRQGFGRFGSRLAKRVG